jgi:hypothetical protein
VARIFDATSLSLYLRKRAIEKHITMIFIKLGLADAEDVSRCVKAVLLLLARLIRDRAVVGLRLRGASDVKRGASDVEQDRRLATVP